MRFAQLQVPTGLTGSAELSVALPTAWSCAVTRSAHSRRWCGRCEVSLRVTLTMVARGQPVPGRSDVARVARPVGAEITGQATRATRTPGRALAKLQSNIDDGALVVGPADRAEVITIAERIAAQPPSVAATGFVMSCTSPPPNPPGTAEFLSFDSNRRWPAVAAGLAATPHRRAAAGRGEFRSAPGHETRECRRSLIANGSHRVSAPGVWMNRAASASVRPKLTALRSDW